MFSWSRHWCFCALAPLFFRGRKSASRAENPKNADAWTRWTSKRVLPVAAISFENVAVRRIQADQSAGARARVAASTARPRGRARSTPENDGVDRQRLTEPGVRQSSGALAAWYRWQHSSKDGATDSTTATDYYAYRLALEQQQARTRGGVAAILRELRRTCVSRNTGSARQRTGRWGQAS